MLIQKKYQGTIPENKILDTHSTSNIDTYSCNYVNNIIENGSNENGDWIKYADGTMICMNTYTTTVDVNNLTGSIYWGAIRAPQTGVFPQTFTSDPIVTINIDNAYLSGWSRNRQSDLRTSVANAIYPYSGISREDVNVVVSYIAIGKWK